jgi:hypothetical protein
MLGPTAVEAVPFDPYADAQGCDIAGGRPAAGGGPPLPASAHLTWMQSENTVSITHGGRVLQADATKQQAVAYAISGFCGKAVDRVCARHLHLEGHPCSARLRLTKRAGGNRRWTCSCAG